MANRTCLGALLLAYFAFTVAADVKRNVEITLYPDCAKDPACEKLISQNETAPNASFPNVAYVRSSSGDDVLHFIMSTVHVPTILVVHTLGDKNQRLSFNWTEILNNGSVGTADLSGAVYTNTSLYHGSIDYSFAVAFTRLIEYDDIDDTADLKQMQQKKYSDPDLWNVRNFTEFLWHNVTQGQNGHSVIFNTTQPQPEPYTNKTAGCMYFEFEFNGDSGRDTDLPRLIFNSNNTQMNFVLDGYVPLFNKSRFALEMALVANYSKDKMSVDEFRSIDDEFSPGVFRVVNWYTAGESNANGAYLQWKPVSYLAAKRERSSGTEVTRYDMQDAAWTSQRQGGLLNDSLLQAFFGPNLYNPEKVVMTSANVSFGLNQDGFYLKNNYTAWTTSMGYGKPPVEGISTMVIIIIIAGLGIPAVIIVFGGIYTCARKARRRDGYEELNNGNPRLN